MTAWVLPNCALDRLRAGDVSTAPLPGAALALTLAVVLALNAAAVWARFRHGSQGFRLIVLALAPVSRPWRSIRRCSPSRGSRSPTSSRPATRPRRSTSVPKYTRCWRRASSEIDALPGLEACSRRHARPGCRAPTSDGRFRSGRVPRSPRYPVTSSVEVYGADRALLSRFAFNLPEDLSPVVAVRRSTCRWDRGRRGLAVLCRRTARPSRGARPCARAAPIGGFDRRARDARLREPALHPAAAPVCRAAAAQRGAPGEGVAGATCNTRCTDGAGRRSTPPTEPPGRLTMASSRSSNSRGIRYGHGCSATTSRSTSS